MTADLPSLTPLANHLWQSTIFVGVIWALTLALKKNRAAVRYWLWFAASVKFLIPFSALVALGSQVSWRTSAPIVQPQWSFVVDNAIQPFAVSTAPIRAVSPHASFTLTPILIAVWLCGVAVGLAFWLKCWMQMRRVRKTATPLPLALPIPTLSSPSQIEPGVFGIFRPVLLLPEGIESRLTPAQLDAIIAHEIAHVRRRDNLTAAVHMLVEIVFWFFPVVWWLRARLIEERENACDEAVLRMGSQAESYAEGIIEVCKSYTESPATCISGISGSDLKQRVIRIVNRRLGENLTLVRKAALAMISVAAIVVPLTVGLVNAPALPAQSSAAGSPKFDVASVKPCEAGQTPSGRRTNADSNSPGRLTLNCWTLGSIIRWAYLGYPEGKPWPTTPGMVQAPPPISFMLVMDQPIKGAPSWVESTRYTIEAESPGSQSVPPPSEAMMRGPMMQSLLEERFNLKLHHEPKATSAFALEVANGRPKLQASQKGSCLPFDIKHPAPQPPGAHHFVPYCGFVRPSSAGGLDIKGVTMSDLCTQFSAWLMEEVVNRTGVMGTFDVHLDMSLADLGSADPSLRPGDSGAGSPGPSDPVGAISSAVKQLGLKLKATKVRGETLVIDHIEEPTPN